MADVIPDPDYESFDGRYVDNSFIAPPAEFNYALLGQYMRENNKEFKDLTPEELEQFKI